MKMVLMMVVGALAMVTVVNAGSFPAKDRLEGSAWPAKIKGHVPPKPGEHPRLFFRKKDIPELKRRAATPEGKMIMKRLRYLLDGKDGETMTTVFSTATSEGGRSKVSGPGMFSHSHAAGYGFLYQMTGDKKYAEFGRQCFEKAFEGIRDKDSRYGFRNMPGALRAGPSIAWFALGYDLCYEGWTLETRKRIIKELLFYNGGHRNTSIDRLAQGMRHHPACNHWGGQISGPPMIALAMMGDPEADQKQVQQLLEWGQKSTLRQLTEGIGDYGFFGGGTGPGVITTDTAFIPLLQAWKNVAGKDFITLRPVGEWLTLHWIMGCVTKNAGGKPAYPVRGTYGHNYWSRTGMSGSGGFCQGFGAISDKYKPALLWLYNRSFLKPDMAAKAPYDSINTYAHRCILALVNWPWRMKEDNPGKVMPKAYLDKYWHLAQFRNRWKDQDDILVSVLLEQAGGHYKSAADTQIIHKGRIHKPSIALRGKSLDIKVLPNGGVIQSEKGSFGVDFSGAGGADVLLVWVGGESAVAKRKKGAKRQSRRRSTAIVSRVKAGKTEFALLAYGGDIDPEAMGDDVMVGDQTVGYDGKFITFAK